MNIESNYLRHFSKWFDLLYLFEFVKDKKQSKQYS